jgi:hypothetical protein
MITFWMVFRADEGVDTGYCESTHPTLEEAKREAEKNAAQLVGSRFIVLQALCACHVPRGAATWEEATTPPPQPDPEPVAADDDIPF